MSTTEKLQNILTAKNAIRDKFNLGDIPFAQYADNIKAGGGGAEYFKCASVSGAGSATDITVSGAGTTDVNGTYTLVDASATGYDRVWELKGTDYQIKKYNSQPWCIYVIRPDDEGIMYYSEIISGEPWDASVWYDTVGSSPAPTVTQAPATDTGADEKTWSGYKAVLTTDTETGKQYYDFEETVTEGLTFGNGFTPVVGGIYDREALIKIDLWFTKFKYMRFQIDAIRSYSEEVQVAEFVFVDKNGNEVFLNTLNIGDITVDPNESSSEEERPENLFSGSIADKWCNANWHDGTSSYVQVHFFDGVDLRMYPKYGWYTGGDFPKRDPISWQVMFSNDAKHWYVRSKVVGFDPTQDRNALAGVWELNESL